MAQSLLEFILRSKKEGTAAQEASKDLEGLETQAKKTSKSGELLGKAWGVTQGAIIAGGVAAIAAVPALLDQGNAIDAAETALIGYTGSAEEAERVTVAVAAAAGGAITKFEATQNASRLFAMGLASTADEAAKMTDMAITLGAAMGEDATTAFENFSLMLANQSIPRLDTFGISGAAVRERMAELQAETVGLDRQTAFLNATMELGADAMRDLDAAGFEAVNNIDRLKTVTEDWKDTLATTVADGLMPIIDGAFMLTDAITEEKNAVAENSATYEEYLKNVDALKDAHPILMVGWEGLTEAEFANEKQAEATKIETQRLENSLENFYGTAAEAAYQAGLYSESLEENEEAANEAATTNSNLAVSLNKVTESTIAREALEALNGMMDEGTLTAEEYSLAAHSVLVNLGGFSSAEADATVALANLRAAYKDGTIKAIEYFSAVQALNSQIAAVPRDVTINFTIKTHGSVPGGSGALPGQPGDPTAYQSGGEFIVSGPPGIDSVPVSFLASRGETVTITPQGLPGPGRGGGVTLVVEGNNFYGVGGIEEFSEVLLPRLQDAMRNG